jgi:hypothetical protein
MPRIKSVRGWKVWTVRVGGLGRCGLELIWPRICTNQFNLVQIVGSAVLVLYQVWLHGTA